ncbi:hypothetical protein KKH46_00850, partial [Patescibacteria group bacterium]|nr:hypothetical protein [Patescibacteria group bacterium]MBU1956317.1 hypothetical protein [Patescibacteria group bacterium]
AYPNLSKDRPWIGHMGRWLIGFGIKACLRTSFRLKIPTQHLFCNTKKVLGGNFASKASS